MSNQQTKSQEMRLNAASARDVVPVKFISRRLGRCRVYLKDGRQLVVHQQASIGRGDLLRVNSGLVEVLCINGITKVYPPYSAYSKHELAGRFAVVHVKETTTDHEKTGVKFLREFHYRKGSPFGRQATLVAKTRINGETQIIGFVELSSAPLLNAARDRILNDAFDSRFVSWKKWDYRTRNHFARAIVEISRIVVHPQVRGYGISQLLLSHAFKYVRGHWQISGIKPIFVEIVAEMLRLCPFVTSAGMTYVGDTEGNIKRVCTDIKYYFGRPKFHKSSVRFEPSFVRMQVKYLRNALKLMQRRGISSIDELTVYLKRASRNPETITDPIVAKIIRNPRPVFLIGLDESSETFLRYRVDRLGLALPATREETPIHRHKDPIIVSDLSVDRRIAVPRSRVACSVARAFSIDEEMPVSIFRSLNMTINPGDIVLVIGPSGAGKTTFINCLIGAIEPCSGRVDVPKDARIGMLTPIRKKGPIIESLGLPANESVKILSNCGLNDVRCYLGSFAQLSAGEKYRVMLARLLASKCNVWVADDFLCNLDPITADSVARGVGKIAKSSGATLIASTSRYDVTRALSPDTILHKPFGPTQIVMTREEFLRTSDQG